MDNYSIGYDPYDKGTTSPGAISVFKRSENADGKFVTVYHSRETIKDNFRLPRKLKKRVKRHAKGKLSPYDLKFHYMAFKMSIYYKVKILLEKAGNVKFDNLRSLPALLKTKPKGVMPIYIDPDKTIQDWVEDLKNYQFKPIR